tara:strand:- start:525 stop:1181 length:657 start_codon:yes stop_codon:yes gene_type:complete
MKKRFLIAIFLLLLFSTYNIEKKFELKDFKIKLITIENNEIIQEDVIKKNLSFLYNQNLFLMKTNEVKNKMNEIDFIDSFKIKKIYPNEIRIKVFEKTPIVILQNKKEKKYYTSKDDVIDFINLKQFQNLPTVFGDKESFKLFYENLKSTKFPLNEIKAFYLFESKRWDLITYENQTLKLPIKNYNKSLKNFHEIKDQENFKKYKIFDYRINNQLILK